MFCHASLCLYVSAFGLQFENNAKSFVGRVNSFVGRVKLALFSFLSLYRLIRYGGFLGFLESVCFPTPRVAFILVIPLPLNSALVNFRFGVMFTMVFLDSFRVSKSPCFLLCSVACYKLFWGKMQRHVVGLLTLRKLFRLMSRVLRRMSLKSNVRACKWPSVYLYQQSFRASSSLQHRTDSCLI